MAEATRATCANCGAEGPVGEACPAGKCAGAGYHCVPSAWLDATRAWELSTGGTSDPRVGRALGRYVLAGKLGEGGMGAGVIALQKPLLREVAIKLIAGVGSSPEAMAAFEREARAISALDHPNIVKLHDYGIGRLDRRVPYMAIEYVRNGRTMREVLARPASGLVAVEDVRVVFTQVLHALAAAHAVGLVHRDVKPENVMVGAVHGIPHLVKVLDFGLATTLDETPDGRGGSTRGTAAYMAPEQIDRQRAPTDGRADLFAVAVMLFEVACGTRPFPGWDESSVLGFKLDPDWQPLDVPEARALPGPLAGVLARGLAPLPADRFPDAMSMLKALDAAFADPALAAGLVGFTTSPARHGVGPLPEWNPNVAVPPRVVEATRVQVPRPVAPFVPVPVPVPALDVDWDASRPIQAAPPPSPPAPVADRAIEVVTAQPRRTRVRKMVAVVLALALGGGLATMEIVSLHRLSATRDGLERLRTVLSGGGRFPGFDRAFFEPADEFDHRVRDVLPAGTPAVRTRDSWGRPYRLRYSPARRAFLLFSQGPDGVSGACREEGGDDVCLYIEDK